MTKKTKIKVPRSVKRLFPNVTSAHDANSSIEVSVTAKDCNDAKRLNPSECALARATRREHHVKGVIIGMTSSYIIKGDKAIRYQTPASVQREITSFDRHGDFAPGDYYLTTKSPQNKLGTTKWREWKSNSNKTVRRKIHHSARVRILPTGSE